MSEAHRLHAFVISTETRFFHAAFFKRLGLIHYRLNDKGVILGVIPSNNLWRF